MEELTNIEKEFINQKLEEHGYEDLDSDDEMPEKVHHRIFPWRWIIVVCVAIMAIPTILTGVMYYNLHRVEGLLGTDTIQILVDPKNAKILSGASNVSDNWIGTLSALYQHRYVYIGAFFTIALIIVMIVLLISLFISNRWKKKV